MTGSSQSRSRLPHWGWFLLVTVLLVVGSIGVSIWLPYQREQQVIQKIGARGAQVERKTVGPDWLQEFVGERRMKEFKVFDRVDLVIWGETDATGTDAGLAQLSGLKNLKSLFLGAAAVTDAGLAHLGRLKGLTFLDLEGTPVTDAGLAHLSGLKNLTRLALDGSAVTDAGLAHLSGLKNLKHLYLSNTKVTDAGLIHMTELKGLITLGLYNTAVTDNGIEQFQKALPDCQILR